MKDAGGRPGESTDEASEEQLSQSIAGAKTSFQPIWSVAYTRRRHDYATSKQKSKPSKNEAVVAVFIESPGGGQELHVVAYFCAAATLPHAHDAIRPPRRACRS